MKCLILFLIAIFGMAACSNEAAPPAFDTSAPLSETSIYLMGTNWTSDAEQTVQLADFRGLPEDADINFVLVSFDPERDTVEQLQAYREAHGLGDEWTLLSSEDVDVRTLAALLDVRYRFEADGNIAHTNLITLLNAGGEIIGRQEGLGVDPASSISILQEAASLAL